MQNNPYARLKQLRNIYGVTKPSMMQHEEIYFLNSSRKCKKWRLSLIRGSDTNLIFRTQPKISTQFIPTTLMLASKTKHTTVCNILKGTKE
jgi:hypothetical protein